MKDKMTKINNFEILVVIIGAVIFVGGLFAIGKAVLEPEHYITTSEGEVIEIDIDKEVY